MNCYRLCSSVLRNHVAFQVVTNVSEECVTSSWRWGLNIPPKCWSSRTRPHLTWLWVFRFWRRWIWEQLSVVWVVAPCVLVEVYRRPSSGRSLWWSRLQELLWNASKFYQTTWGNIQQESHLRCVGTCINYCCIKFRVRRCRLSSSATFGRGVGHRPLRDCHTDISYAAKNGINKRCSYMIWDTTSVHLKLKGTTTSSFTPPPCW